MESGTENQLNILCVYMVADVRQRKLSAWVHHALQQRRSDFNWMYTDKLWC